MTGLNFEIQARRWVLPGAALLAQFVTLEAGGAEPGDTVRIAFARKARRGGNLQEVLDGFLELCQILTLAPASGEGPEIKHPVVLSIERDHDVPSARFRLAGKEAPGKLRGISEISGFQPIDLNDKITGRRGLERRRQFHDDR